MKKITVIFTGGTIGSTVRADGLIAPREKGAYQLIESYKQKRGSVIRFLTREPYNILSEMMDGEYLTRLVREVQESLVKDDSDGLIITHGTDTLAYTAAIIGYLFAEAPIPILFVAAAHPLNDDRTNGFANFDIAVQMIMQGGHRGAYVPFVNHDGQARVHYATRLVAPRAYDHDCASVGDAVYAAVREGQLICRQEKIDPGGGRGIGIDPSTLVLQQPSEILRITPYVGMDYPVCSDTVRAVLLETFHSGTLCMDNQAKHFLRTMQERSIPTYLTGTPRSEAAYASTEAYASYGVCALEPSSPVAQYCKLWIALSAELTLDAIMKRSIAHDFYD